MIESGIYHPFNFVSKISDIKQDLIYKAPVLDAIINGDYTSITLHKYSDNSEVANFQKQTYVFNNIDIYYFRVYFSGLEAGVQYYLKITNTVGIVTAIEYSESLIEHSCNTLQLFTSHDCYNQYYDWQNISIGVYLNNWKEIEPEVKKDSSVIITDKGSITQHSNLQLRNRIEFIGLSTEIRFLEAITLNSKNEIVTIQGKQEIVNIEVEGEQIGTTEYSKYIISFVYKDTLNENDACCLDVNIDDIQNENPGSVECGDFTAEITENSGTLTVTLTSAPIGTALYKWYRDNVYLSNATSITVEGAGNYRVDVTIEGCRATASWFKDDVCRLFQIQVTKTNNDINATASNIPEGESVIWSVEFGGISVSSSLPYTALASGIYYVRATAGECSQIKGINVILEDDDCDFTIDITDNTTTLEADTNAGTPSYLWELETGAGRTTIGSTTEITPTGKGIYWLTITNGGCSKETYLYKEPLTESVVYLNSKATGTTFAVGEIDLSAIVSPATELEVYINGVMNPYISTTPTTIGFYTINASNEIQIFQTITNGTIKIIKK